MTYAGQIIQGELLYLSVVVCLLNVCAKILTKIRCRSRTESDHRGVRAENWMLVCMNAIVSEYFYVTRENTDQVIFNCLTCCETFKTLRKMKLMLNFFKNSGWSHDIVCCFATGVVRYTICRCFTFAYFSEIYKQMCINCYFKKFPW